MFDNLTFAELEAQQVELLPPRTVLSLFSVAGPRGPSNPGVGYSTPPPPWCVALGNLCTVNATAGTALGGKHG
jgi:hypothetical protein